MFLPIVRIALDPSNQPGHVESTLMQISFKPGVGKRSGFKVDPLCQI
jgi:hypothetical protein